MRLIAAVLLAMLALPAPADPPDARETGSLLVSLSEQPVHFDEKVLVDPGRGTVDGAGGAFTVSVPYGRRKDGAGYIVNFDKDGKLQGLGVVAK